MLSLIASYIRYITVSAKGFFSYPVKTLRNHSESGKHFSDYSFTLLIAYTYFLQFGIQAVDCDFDFSIYLLKQKSRFVLERLWISLEKNVLQINLYIGSQNLPRDICINDVVRASIHQ